MKVFILIHIEPYEGYDIKGVYSTLKKAKEHKGKDDDILHWKVDGKDVTPVLKIKGGLKRQIELNAAFLNTFVPKELLKDLFKTESPS